MLGYLFITIAITFATVILVYNAYGFSVDKNTGNIVQNGLVFIDSSPNQADIYIDNVKRGQTNARFVLLTGTYTAKIKKSGYRDWQRSFTIEGNKILRFAYPFLFPTTLTTEINEVYVAKPAFTSESPDRHWVVVQAPQKDPAAPIVLKALDTSKPTAQAAPLNLAADLFKDTPGQASTLKEVEWSSDNKSLLLEHDFSSGSEFIVVNRDAPEKSFNVNKLFNIAPTKVTLFDKKIEQLFIFNQKGGTLSIANVKDKAVASPILKSISSYKTYSDDVISYVTSVGSANGMVQVRIREKNSTTYPLVRVTAGSVYLLDIARFQNDWYYVAGSDKDDKVRIFKNPLDKIKDSDIGRAQPLFNLKISGTEKISFSENARFIAAEAGQNMAIYDLETDNNYYYKIDVPLAAPLHWMDGHRLIGTTDNNIMVMDYDNINRQLLTGSSMPTGGYFDRDFEELISLAPSGSNGSTVLKFTSLKPPVSTQSSN